MTEIRKEGGFTLVELSTAMAAGSLLVLAFASIMVLTRRQWDAVSLRVNSFQDVMVLNGYVHKQLSAAIGDSTRIYADAAAEAANSPSTSGTILRTRDVDGRTYRIGTSGQILTWDIDGQTHNPMDSRVTDLQFQESNSPTGKKVDMTVAFESGEDTLVYEWSVHFRN
ncbi:MAG: type II secretion system protein J [Fidelibacterota bacterium]